MGCAVVIGGSGFTRMVWFPNCVDLLLFDSKLIFLPSVIFELLGFETNYIYCSVERINKNIRSVEISQKMEILGFETKWLGLDTNKS